MRLQPTHGHIVRECPIGQAHQGVVEVPWSCLRDEVERMELFENSKGEATFWDVVCTGEDVVVQELSP